MPAGGRVTTGRDDNSERERFYRRDGTVIVRCHGGTGRYWFDVMAGRDGNFQREIFYRRDGTVRDDRQGNYRRDGTAGLF